MSVLTALLWAMALPAAGIAVAATPALIVWWLTRRDRIYWDGSDE